MSPERVAKVVVTWSALKDQLLGMAQQRGRSDIRFVVEDDRGMILQELADAEVAVVGPWDEQMFGVARRFR